MKPEKSDMPAIIVGIALLGFYVQGSFIMLYAAGAFGTVTIELGKVLSIVDMYVIAGIGLTTGGVGYWLGTTHNSANKDIMLHNSTPSPVPTEKIVTSTTTSSSMTEPEPKS